MYLKPSCGIIDVEPLRCAVRYLASQILPSSSAGSRRLNLGLLICFLNTSLVFPLPARRSGTMQSPFTGVNMM